MKDNNAQSLPDEMRIACCKICLLAEAMKDCNKCPFNIGLGFKALQKHESVYTPQLKISFNKA